MRMIFWLVYDAGWYQTPPYVYYTKKMPLVGAELRVFTVITRHANRHGATKYDTFITESRSIV